MVVVCVCACARVSSRGSVLGRTRSLTSKQGHGTPPQLNCWRRRAVRSAVCPSQAKIHGHGLKMGAWIMGGVPRMAVEARSLIKGTQWTAADIAIVDGACGGAAWHGTSKRGQV